MQRHSLLAAGVVAFLSAAITWYLVDPQAFVLYKYKLNLQRLLLSTNASSIGSPASTTFVFYKFSLQWPPATCSSKPEPGKPIFICGGPIPTKFTIHGLWPQDANDRGIRPYDENKNCIKGVKPVPESNLMTYLQKNDFDKNVLKPVWPNLRDSDSMPDNQVFWEDEWRKHGKCSDYADQPLDYFQAAVNFKKGLDDVLGLTRGRPYTVEEVQDIVRKYIDDKDAEIACSRDINTNDLLLKELRICYDKAKPPVKPQNCQKAYSGECDNEKDVILFK